MKIPDLQKTRSLVVCSVMATLLACQSNPVSQSIESTEGIASGAENSAIIAPVTPARTIVIPQSEPAIDNLWQRVRAGFQLQEFYYHPDVTEQLQRYVDNQAYFDLTIERARPFLYFIVVELEERDLPLELALMPFVESGFNPVARSSEQAVGIWQFMGATAASFGLQQDWWYDARRDPHASTIAALDYLKELYQLFEHDWLLALAAYNAGDGNVRRAIRRSNSATTENPFWELALPRETRLHVPRILAMARLVYDHNIHGVALAPIANSEPLSRVEVGTQIDLFQAAQLADMEYGKLRELNPGYLQWATHPDQPQHILLPHANANLFKDKIASLPSEQFLTWDHYMIESGDTLSGIARRLGIRVDVLQRVNNLRGTQIIAGRSLLIPRGSGAETTASSPILANALQPAPIPDTYRVRSGDNLWSIAKRFDLRSADIALWNGIALEATLYPGQIIQFRQ